DQDNTSMNAIGRGARTDGDGNRRIVVGVLDQRVADVAQHLVPDATTVGAEVDAIALKSAINEIQVARWVGNRILDAAIGIEDHVTGLAGAHESPVIAAVLAAPDAAVTANHRG